MDISKQTWDQFQLEVDGKKIFIFGTGKAADVYWARCHRQIEGIIDNDRNKWNKRAEEIIEGAYRTESSSILISGVETLKEYDNEESVVLIASTRHYEEIVRQLEELGYYNVYILHIMEANYRQKQYAGKNTIEYVPRYIYAKEFCKEKISNNKIAFYSFGSYSDHGKYITEALLKIRTDLDLVWFVKDINVEVPEGVRKVCTGNWKRYLYELETARVWIYNMAVPDYLIKREGQIYIQTKHWASVTLKKFYLDSATIQDVSENVAKWKYNSKIMDYIITGSDFDTQSCRRGFGFHKEVWQIGSPRSDALFCQKKCKEKVYSYYHIRPDVHTLIYAPTYRFDKSSENRLHESRGIDLDFQGVKMSLEKKFGGEWYIILRLHPSVAKESDKITKQDFVIDASNYADSEELVSACDIMISDYSSIMFEPAFVYKPVFLFATDKKDYIDQEYDLLLDYDALPFPIAESNEELVHKIKEFQHDKYEKEVDVFLDRYGVCEDGHASERAAQLISKLMNVPEPTGQK